MTPAEFCLHGGWNPDGSDHEPVTLTVDRHDRDHPVQLAMYPFERAAANERIPGMVGMVGFLSPDQLDDLIDALTYLRDCMEYERALDSA